jgi:hypothetical protein
MSDAARWMIALHFIALPTIAFGGHFLLSILRRKAGTEGIGPTQRDYFRAGHAHAGLLVVLAIVGQLVLDHARLGDGPAWALRIGLLAAPLLISGGFFLGAPRRDDDAPSRPIVLVTLGAVVLGLSTIGIGIGLLVPA